MLELERFITQYVELEDRIRLIAQTKQGGVMVLWLTQRLLNRLVPYFCHWLQSQSTAVTPALQYVHQGFAQQAAQLALQQSVENAVQLPTPTAQLGADVNAVLVHGVQITATGDHLMLGFKDVQGTVHAQLPLSTKVLRQWLCIIKKQYRKAHWPIVDWPQWLQASDLDLAATPSSRAVLH